VNPRSRHYKSPRRVASARATRRDIIEAARALFAKKGYSRTSIADIAKAANVSVQTIYDSVGSKGALARSLSELISDDAEVGALETKRGAADGRTLIALHVKTARVLNERFGDVMEALQSAAPAAPGAARVIRDGVKRHHGDAKMTAEQLGKLGALKKGVSQMQAQVLLSLTTLPQVLLRGHDDLDATWDMLERWITEALCAVLLG